MPHFFQTRWLAHAFQRIFLSGLHVLAIIFPVTCSAANAEEVTLTYRVQHQEFKASNADIRMVLDYAGRPLLKNFQNYQIEPIVVIKGNGGPITLFKRNDKGEIVIKLATEGTLWSQYSYQWAHELCHVLCGFRNDGTENDWFEETICELASLYCMRAMSKDWAANPPYPNWKSYAPHLKTYADQTAAKYEKLTADQLAGFYKKHREALRKDSTLRHHNGAMAVALLPMFEKDPKNWGAMRYLNVTSAKKGLSFKAYLSKWHKDAPKEHRAFVLQIAKLYGINQL